MSSRLRYIYYEQNFDSVARNRRAVHLPGLILDDKKRFGWFYQSLGPDEIFIVTPSVFHRFPDIFSHTYVFLFPFRLFSLSFRQRFRFTARYFVS